MDWELHSPVEIPMVETIGGFECDVEISNHDTDHLHQQEPQQPQHIYGLSSTDRPALTSATTSVSSFSSSSVYPTDHRSRRSPIHLDHSPSAICIEVNDAGWEHSHHQSILSLSSSWPGAVVGAANGGSGDRRLATQVVVVNRHHDFHHHDGIQGDENENEYHLDPSHRRSHLNHSPRPRRRKSSFAHHAAAATTLSSSSSLSSLAPQQQQHQEQHGSRNSTSSHAGAFSSSSSSHQNNNSTTTTTNNHDSSSRPLLTIVRFMHEILSCYGIGNAGMPLSPVQHQEQQQLQHKAMENVIDTGLHSSALSSSSSPCLQQPEQRSRVNDVSEDTHATNEDRGGLFVRANHNKPASSIPTTTTTKVVTTNSSLPSSSPDALAGETGIELEEHDTLKTDYELARV